MKLSPAMGYNAGRWPPIKIKIMATSGRLNVDAMDMPEGGRFLP
jgi:hypothetical protein